MPLKFVKPPKEFRIYGNVVRQTLLDDIVVPLKNIPKKKIIYQSRITQFFK